MLKSAATTCKRTHFAAIIAPICRGTCCDRSVFERNPLKPFEYERARRANPVRVQQAKDKPRTEGATCRFSHILSEKTSPRDLSIGCCHTNFKQPTAKSDPMQIADHNPQIYEWNGKFAKKSAVSRFVFTSSRYAVSGTTEAVRNAPKTLQRSFIPASDHIPIHDSIAALPKANKPQKSVRSLRWWREGDRHALCVLLCTRKHTHSPW